MHSCWCIVLFFLVLGFWIQIQIWIRIELVWVWFELEERKRRNPNPTQQGSVQTALETQPKSHAGPDSPLFLSLPAAHQLSSAQPDSSLPHSAAQFSGPARDLPPSRSGPNRTGLLPPQPSCNTRFIKEHKPCNHIRARIKSHVYTTEWTVYHSTYHVKRYNKANTYVIYYINDENVWYNGSEVQVR